MKRTLIYVAHHDDPPCEERLVVNANGSRFCPHCNVYPDMQSIALWAYCPRCQVPLNRKTLRCPACERVYRRPTAKKAQKWHAGEVFEYKTYSVPGRTLPHTVGGYGVAKNRKTAVLFAPTGNGNYDLTTGQIPENAQPSTGPFPDSIRLAISAVFLALH